MGMKKELSWLMWVSVGKIGFRILLVRVFSDMNIN